MININFDKRLELIFGLQYCVFKDNNIEYDIFSENNKNYCEEFYRMYKYNASRELIDYIKNGGFDTYNRTVEIVNSLDENYSINEDENIKNIIKNNRNFDKNKLELLLKDFVTESNYEKFYEEHKEYYNEVIDLFKEKLNKFVEFNEKIITDFYGFKLCDFQIKLFNFTLCSFGTKFGDKITYIANTYPSSNEKEPVRIPDTIIATLFHEYSHPYCNPLGYKYFNNIDISNIVNESKENGLENSYDGITVINEYVVRAVQVYLTTKYLPKEYYNPLNDINRHKKRGFVHIEELVKLLDLKDHYDNFEDFYKNQIVPFFCELTNIKLL